MEDNLKIEAGKTLAEMRELLDSNPKGFDAETAQKYERLEADHDAALRAIEARDRLADRETPVVDEEARNLALGGGETVDLGENTPVDVDPTATAEYARAFDAYLRGEQRADLVKGTSNVGGYLVPQEFSASIISSLTAQSPVLDKARTFTTSSGDKINYPVVTFDTSTAPINAPKLASAAIAEGGTYSVSNDEFSTVIFDSFKFGAITRASDELLRDSIVPIDALIREQAVKSLGYQIGTQVATGSGSSAPQGYNNAATGVTAASTTAVTANELIDMQSTIGVPYRQNAEWLVSDSALKAYRKLVDSNGRYLLQWDFAVGAPQTMLGRPVTVDPYLPAVAASAKHTVYGDFNAGFGIRRVAGINIKYLQELYAASGLVGWRLDVACDSRLLDPAALSVYKQKAS